MPWSPEKCLRFPDHPYLNGHGSNGKNASAAVLFSQIEGREMECESFTRITLASSNSREYGHTGQGFSYLWEGLATRVNLKQGQRLDIGLAYANETGPAAARLKWLGPAVAGTSGGIIP